MSYESIKSIVVLLLLLIAGGLFLWRCYRLLWVNLRRGRPSGIFNSWSARIKALVVYVAGQKRLFRFLVPGTAHFFIFWGFLILFPTILQAIVEGLTAFTAEEYSVPLAHFGPIMLLKDLLALFVIVAVIYDLYTGPILPLFSYY